MNKLYLKAHLGIMSKKSGDFYIENICLNRLNQQICNYGDNFFSVLNFNRKKFKCP